MTERERSQVQNRIPREYRLWRRIEIRRAFSTIIRSNKCLRPAPFPRALSTLDVSAIATTHHVYIAHRSFAEGKLNVPIYIYILRTMHVYTQLAHRSHVRYCAIHVDLRISLNFFEIYLRSQTMWDMLTICIRPARTLCAKISFGEFVFMKAKYGLIGLSPEKARFFYFWYQLFNSIPADGN